jgi:hypothetical protein
VLSWAVATRLQLDRWEALVAQHLRNELHDHARSSGGLIWQAQFEHHFCLIAARHLLRALDMSGLKVVVDGVLRDEIVEGRDLLEHWDENMPVFNAQPRARQAGRKTGNAFAERNPRHGPYWWLGWDYKVGPKLLPHVPSASVRALLDEVEACVLQDAPELSEYLLPRSDSPWLDDWSPRPRPSVTEDTG